MKRREVVTEDTEDTEDIKIFVESDKIFTKGKYIGRGDEGVVYEAFDENRNKYAIKIYHKEVNQGIINEIIDTNYFLSTLNIASKIYSCYTINNILFLITDFYDITLEKYLILYPNKNKIYIRKVISILNEMIALDKFDYDVKLDNIMLNLGEPYHLYFIDCNLSSIDEDPEYIKEILENFENELMGS